MAEKTGIEWCDSTFNPWLGCTKVSPACDNCYAEALMDKRMHRVKWGTGQQRQRTSDANWREPLKWQKQHAEFKRKRGRRRRVFCASLADVFDNEVPIEWLVDLLELIRTTPNLDWLLLSKRIGNWWSRIREAIGYLDAETPAAYPMPLRAWLAHWRYGDDAPRNVWLGATFADQSEVDRDMVKLFGVPSVVRFGSFEPMLGPIQLPRVRCDNGSLPGPAGVGGVTCPNCCGAAGGCTRLHWVICGGESGPNARPMHPGWARSLRDQCAAAGVPFLFKQWGQWLPPMQDGSHEHDPMEINASDVPIKVGTKAAGRLLDGREHMEWPR